MYKSMGITGEHLDDDNKMSQIPESWTTRKSNCLKGYDYTNPGTYFVAISTWRRQNLFGRVNRGGVILNKNGEVARRSWSAIPEHFGYAALAEFIVMPDHVHGTIFLMEPPVGTSMLVPYEGNKIYG